MADPAPPPSLPLSRPKSLAELCEQLTCTPRHQTIHGPLHAIPWLVDGLTRNVFRMALLPRDEHREARIADCEHSDTLRGVYAELKFDAFWFGGKAGLNPAQMREEFAQLDGLVAHLLGLNPPWNPPPDTILLRQRDDLTSEEVERLTQMERHDQFEEEFVNLLTGVRNPVMSRFAELAAVVMGANGLTVTDFSQWFTESTPREDGPFGGRYVQWQGIRHKVPSGVIYKLIRYFWPPDRVQASYKVLTKDVFDSGSYEDATFRNRASEASKYLRDIGVPWELSADSQERVIVRCQPRPPRPRKASSGSGAAAGEEN